MLNTRHSAVSVLLCLLFLLLGNGCVKQSLPISYYTLSTSGEGSPTLDTSSLPKLIISPIDLPSFLDQGQIISRTSPYSIKIEEQRRWAAELPDMIGQIVKISLIKKISLAPSSAAEYRSPSKTLRIALSFTHFEKGMDGKAHLTLNWKILGKDATTVKYSKSSSFTVPTDDPSFEALVKALSQGLEMLSREIAEKLLLSPQPQGISQ